MSNQENINNFEHKIENEKSIQKLGKKATESAGSFDLEKYRTEKSEAGDLVVYQDEKPIAIIKPGNGMIIGGVDKDSNFLMKSQKEIEQIRKDLIEAGSVSRTPTDEEEIIAENESVVF